MEIFNDNDFFRLITYDIIESIKSKIVNHNRVELLNIDYDKLLQYFIDYFKIENIILDDKNLISNYEEKEQGIKVILVKCLNSSNTISRTN